MITTEVEKALLLNHQDDIAVHSLKDMQTTIYTEGLVVSAISQREQEQVNDIIVSANPITSLYDNAMDADETIIRQILEEGGRQILDELRRKKGG